MSKVSFRDDEFMNAAVDTIFNRMRIETDPDELKILMPEILEQVGKTLKRNRSKSKPFGFKVFDPNENINYFSASTNYRAPEDEADNGNFGIDLSLNNNLRNFTECDFLDDLESDLRTKHKKKAGNRFMLRDFVIGTFGAIHQFLLDNVPQNDGEIFTLEFPDLLLCKVGWKGGKPAIKFTAGSEIKKRIKADIDLVE